VVALATIAGTPTGDSAGHGGLSQLDVESIRIKQQTAITAGSLGAPPEHPLPIAEHGGILKPARASRGFREIVTRAKVDVVEAYLNATVIDLANANQHT